MLQQSTFGHGVRSLVKASLPSSLFRKARFLKRLSIYYRMETSDLIQRDMNAGVDCIFLNRSLRLRLPDDALAHNVFRSMAFEAEEWRSFLKLASGCRAFVDIGASGGFFSALFAASRQEPVQILSIEPDPPSRIALANVRDRNMCANTEWIIDGRATSTGGAGTGDARRTVSMAARSRTGSPDEPVTETDFTTPRSLIWT